MHERKGEKKPIYDFTTAVMAKEWNNEQCTKPSGKAGEKRNTKNKTQAILHCGKCVM